MRRLLAGFLGRDRGISDWGVSSGYGEKWAEVGQVLEMEPVGVADGVDAGSDMKRESKSDAEVQGLRPRWMLVPLTMTGETRGEACRGCCGQELCSCHVKSEVPIRAPPLEEHRVGSKY